MSLQRRPFAYVVCHDLNQRAEMYVPFFAELMNSYKWWHFLSSTWIVLRHDTLVDFQDRLNELIYQSDRLLIMPAKGPAGGWLPVAAWTWIRENAPKEW